MTMARKTTMKILLALLGMPMTGCSLLSILPPREVFIPQFTLHHPNNPHALFMEGKSYLSQDQPHKAAARFREALRLQPSFGEARLGLAHAYREGGSYRYARKEYRVVLEKAPANIQALEGLANCEMHLGQPNEAERLLKCALEISPKSVSTLNAMADLFYGQRQYDKALSYWEKSLALNPKQSQSLKDLVQDLHDYVRQYGQSLK
jgi:tetratricopeptide (TPR) repeat protein